MRAFWAHIAGECGGTSVCTDVYVLDLKRYTKVEIARALGCKGATTVVKTASPCFSAFSIFLRL